MSSVGNNGELVPAENRDLDKLIPISGTDSTDMPDNVVVTPVIGTAEVPSHNLASVNAITRAEEDIVNTTGLQHHKFLTLIEDLENSIKIPHERLARM